MNKSEMKSVFEGVEKKLKSNKTTSFMAHDNKPAWSVFNEMWENGQRRYTFNETEYRFVYHPSHPTIGNRSSTAEFEVVRSTKKELLDADAILAKKEIRVVDYRGGNTKRLEETLLMNKDGEYVFPLEDNKSINTIVGIILQNTKYNIMISHHDTGDVTIAIDNYRFQQR